MKLILPVAAMAVLGGCVVTSGRTETRDHALSGFDTIRADSGIDVVLNQGPFAVRSEAPEGRLDMIVVEQNGRELRLSRKSEMMVFGNIGRHVVNVSAPMIAAINASGGADVDSPALQADALSVNASGGADIEISGLRLTRLSASATGGGDIDLSGSCTTAAMDASAGGDIDASGLMCVDVTATASGGGDVDAFASGAAAGSASAGGDVNFIGAPVNFTANKTSGGDVSVEGR